MTSRYFEEVSRWARKHGIAAETKAAELLLKFDGVESFRITRDGDIFYRAAVNITVAQDRKLNEMIRQADTIGNYIAAIESAPFLNVSGPAGEYKQLLDYNHCVLAGKDMGKYGFEFVSWQWDCNHAAVERGNYFADNYAAAKEDFARRSGLIDSHRLLDPEKEMQVYRLVRGVLDMGPDASERDLLNDIRYDLECTMPEAARTYHTEMLAKDPRTGYIAVRDGKLVHYATGKCQTEDAILSTSGAQPDFVLDDRVGGPYAGLAELCREKIHLRDFEPRWDYPLMFREQPDATSMVNQLYWAYGANSGFVLRNVALIKAVSDADEWLLCKNDEGRWNAIDHVSVDYMIGKEGTAYFERWLTALQTCPAEAYPEHFHIPDAPEAEQAGPTMQV